VSAPNESRPPSAAGGSPALEDLLRAFEDAWQHGRPSIDKYLPPAGPGRWPALVELVHTDLEVRLKAGELMRVENYLRRYPELAGDRAVVLELLAAEYRLRLRREPALTPAEYLARFPQYRADLPAALRRPAGPAPTGSPRARETNLAGPAGATVVEPPSATARHPPGPGSRADLPAAAGPATPAPPEGLPSRAWRHLIVVAVVLFALAAALAVGYLLLVY
jgi:hypothetical protein